MKFTGKGTDKNIQEARQWLSVAAQKGDIPAIELLENINHCFVRAQIYFKKLNDS